MNWLSTQLSCKNTVEYILTEAKGLCGLTYQGGIANLILASLLVTINLLQLS